MSLVKSTTRNHRAEHLSVAVIKIDNEESLPSGEQNFAKCLGVRAGRQLDDILVAGLAECAKLLKQLVHGRIYFA
jgi:hypothetical protein